MTTSNLTVVHPVTGEVLDAEAVARELARLHHQAEEARKEWEHLARLRDQLEPAARAALTDHGRLDAGDWWAVLIPPARRPAQRVDQAACRRHAEQLAGIGVGGYVTDYRPPTAAEIRAHAATVAAAGLNVDELLPPAADPRMELALVPKDAA